MASAAARLRPALVEQLRSVQDLYLASLSRLERRAVPTVSRALGWDWPRLAPDLVDRLTDRAILVLAAELFDRAQLLLEAGTPVVADLVVDDDARRDLAAELRAALGA